MFPKHRKYMHAYTCIHRTIPHKASPSTFVPPLTPRSSGQALGRDCKSASSKRVKRIRYTDLLDENILKLPRTHSCFGLIERDDKLDYDLPRKGAVAGHILRHCYSVLDLYLKKWTTYDLQGRIHALRILSFLQSEIWLHWVHWQVWAYGHCVCCWWNNITSLRWSRNDWEFQR